MPVLVHDAQLKIVRRSISLIDFPGLLQAHHIADASTGEVEALGTNYVANDFPGEQTANFVQQVCTWGNYSGVAGRILGGNGLGSIADSFRDGCSALTRGDAAAAINAVTQINGLAVSFGSKHLRFLDPHRAIVLDRIISERLGYPRTAPGYAEFVADCTSIRDILNGANIVRPPEGTWRVSDVEMAIFMHLQEN